MIIYSGGSLYVIHFQDLTAESSYKLQNIGGVILGDCSG